jgi:GTP cyclohydrolase FolE2
MFARTLSSDCLSLSSQHTLSRSLSHATTHSQRSRDTLSHTLNQTLSRALAHALTHSQRSSVCLISRARESDLTVLERECVGGVF